MVPSVMFGMSSYEFFNILGTVVGMIYIIIFLKVRPKRDAFFAAIIFAVFAVAGARLLWACYDLEHRFTVQQIFRFKYGAMDLGGSFLLFPIALLIIHKLFKVNYKDLFNVSIEAFIIGSAIAKFACYSASCCRGIPTDLPWAVRGLHPVQLYEVGIWILVYIAAVLTKNRMNLVNRLCVIGICCILVRMPIETLRADSRLFIEGGYWIAYQIAVILGVIVLYINNRKNLKKSLIAFMIVSIVLLGVIVGYQKLKPEPEVNYENLVVPHGGVDSGVTDGVGDTQQEVEEDPNEIKFRDKFIQTQEDGTSINISEELTKTKTVDGLEISNISLTRVDFTTTFLADVTNNTSKKKGDYLVDIILFNNYGQEFDRIVGYIDEVKPGGTVQINAAKVVDFFDYVYDVKVEVKK